MRLRVLIVDDEKEWLAKLSAIVSDHSECELVALDGYESADTYITSHDMSAFSAALIDVRLRKQIYDQGGLALLNLLKDRKKELPVLVLTAYSYDYPGLRDVTERYPFVYAYDKEVFEKQPAPILNVLFAELPPQVGGRGLGQRMPITTPPASGLPRDRNQTALVWREIAGGGLFVGLVLAAALLFFLLSSRFTGFSRQLDIVFAVMMVALIAVLLRIFKPAIVKQAVAIFKQLMGFGPPGKPGRLPDAGRSRGTNDAHRDTQQTNSSDRQP